MKARRHIAAICAYMASEASAMRLKTDALSELLKSLGPPQTLEVLIFAANMKF